MQSLPSVILSHIYEYDGTFREKFKECINEISLLKTKYIVDRYFRTEEHFVGDIQQVTDLVLYSKSFRYIYQNARYTVYILDEWYTDFYDPYIRSHHLYGIMDYNGIVQSFDYACTIPLCVGFNRLNSNKKTI